MKRILLLVLIAFNLRAQTTTTIESPTPKQEMEARLEKRYPDLFKLDTVNKTWREAAKTPGMLFAGATLFGSTVFEIEMTQRCIAVHTCREGNPLAGQSRAQEYAVGMAANGLIYYLAVREKKKGHGMIPFVTLYSISLYHATLGAFNRSLGPK